MILFDAEKALREVQLLSGIMIPVGLAEYGMAAFIATSFNPSAWELGLRVTLVIAWLVSLVFYAIFRTAPTG